MENQNITPEASVICPNCGCSHMTENNNFFATIDLLEGLCILLLTLVFTLAGVWSCERLFLAMDAPADLPLLARAAGWLLVAGLALASSIDIVGSLSREQNRNNGISIWYVRCSHCHRQYRIVRPLDFDPPWLAEEDPNEESCQNCGTTPDAESP